MIFVYITTSDQKEARKIGRALVESRLAACANILESMNSIYWWDGKVQEAAEAVLIVKQTSFDEAQKIKDWLVQQQSGVMQSLFSHMLGELSLNQTLAVRISIPAMPDALKPGAVNAPPKEDTTPKKG